MHAHNKIISVKSIVTIVSSDLFGGGMKIGELAALTHCDIQTIRYYEREGLIELPARLNSGYRHYEARHEEQLHFVCHCRSLGMPIVEIKLLLAFKYQPMLGCKEINDLLLRQIERTKIQITTLQALENQLRDLSASCQETRRASECGILKNLTEAANGNPCDCHHNQ